ncbi:hypothetical protein MKX01_002774 [Papaver californicum]|nr:hypothetical protein MKX01_002774 [Papaver californicum]
MANKGTSSNNSALISMIADEDTITGFMLAGGGQSTVKAIEDAFKDFTAREDIDIVLISQYVANMIRFLVDSYNKPAPFYPQAHITRKPTQPSHHFMPATFFVSSI